MSYGSRFFNEDNLDLISDLKLLREENWRAAGYEERLALLRECELRISQYEKRPTVPVEIRTFSDASKPGRFHCESNEIQISKDLLKGDSPYEALSVLIEESHHAFQHHAIKNPGFYEGPHIEEWRANYVNYNRPPTERDPPEIRPILLKKYKEQPIEKTANDVHEKVVRDLIVEHGNQRSHEELVRVAEQERSNVTQSNRADTKDESKNKNATTKSLPIEIRENSGSSEIVVRDESGKEQSIEMTKVMSKMSAEQKQKLVDVRETRKNLDKTHEPQTERQDIAKPDRQQEKNRDRNR